ncbi:probable CTD small phosphatase-like protein 2 at N-terminal half [Coccomyxa sp. Obi]|nr:probable CTD small phosphatase-like protein 2 at N-terminal half [Coccomyxa sp. Obi]
MQDAQPSRSLVVIEWSNHAIAMASRSAVQQIRARNPVSMNSEQDCRTRSRRRKPLHPLNSMQGLSDSEHEASSGVEGRAAKRARREHDSSSSGRDDLLLAPLPPPQTSEEAAAASREQAEEAAEYLNFLSSLPHISKVARRSRRPLLPPQRPGPDGRARKTLVLDLDHTLIRSTLFNPAKPAKGSREVFVTGDGARTSFERRPHLAHFLATVSALFEVAVFTAGSQSYAGPLLDILDPDHTTFEHRLFRDSCLRVPSHSQPGLAFLMKDMSTLGRDLSSTIIVDNTPTVFGYQLNNGIPIASWYEDSSDCELLHLLPFLAELAVAEDVRPLVAHRFPLHRMVHSAMSKFPAAFPCAQPTPGPERRRPPLPPAAPADTNLGLLADACLGLACDEDLGNSPFVAIDELPEPDVAVCASAVACLPEPDQDLAPVERMAAEANAALSRMSAAAGARGEPPLGPAGCDAAHLEPDSPATARPAAAASEAADVESMWASEAIAEADMLSHLEEAGSPVEAVAQLSLPMFPEAATPPETPTSDRLQPPGAFTAPHACVQSASAQPLDRRLAEAFEAAMQSSRLIEPLQGMVARSDVSEAAPSACHLKSGFEATLASAAPQQRPCTLLERAAASSAADSGCAAKSVLRETASAPPALDLTGFLLDKDACHRSDGSSQSAGMLTGQQGGPGRAAAVGRGILPQMGRASSAGPSLDFDALEELFAPSSLIGSILSASSADSTEGGGSMCSAKEVQSPQIACA